MNAEADQPAFRGIFPALWVPVDLSGKFDERASRDQISVVKRAGVNGFMVMGTTGEFARFELDERKRIAEFQVAATSPMPVMLNVSHPGFHHALELARHGKELGVAAIALLPPYYYKNSQENLARFFIEIGQRSGLPLVLYNFPELAGTRIEPETVAAVCQATKVVAMKHSGTEFDYHRQLLELSAAHRFALLSGFDLRLGEVLWQGGAGCVSGLANAVPELLVTIFRKPTDKSSAHKLAEFHGLLSPLEFPLNISAGMAGRGFNPGSPKQPVTEATSRTYAEVVDRVRAWAAGAGLPSC